MTGRSWDPSIRGPAAEKIGRGQVGRPDLLLSAMLLIGEGANRIADDLTGEE